MALIPSGAEAATVTIGSPLTGTPSPGLSTLPSTWTNTVLPAGATLGSPSDGTIVRWRIVGAGGGPFSLRVLSPAGGTTYTGAGTGPLQTPTTIGVDAIQIFPANLPIRAGQIVGFDNAGTMDAFSLTTVTGATYTDWTPPLPDASTLPYTNPYGAGAEIDFNADVRYCLVPTLIGKRIGAAKQALATADCALGTLTRPKSRAKRKGAKFVRGESVAAGTSISDTAPIDLALGKKPQHKKR